MLINKDNSGRVIGWQEVYIGEREIVNVSVNGNISMISKRDRTTGQVESQTFFGKPLLPSDFGQGNK